MSKKIKRLLIVVLGLAVLVGVYFLLTRVIIKPQTDASKDRKKDNIAVSQVGAENIVSFSYSCDDTDNQFLKLYRDDDNVWHYQDDPDFPLNQTYVTKMAEGLAKVEAERVITKEQAGELSEYGLDQPIVSIQFTEKDGTENEFLIGNVNESTQNYYFKKNDDSNIYQINADLKVNFMMGLYDLFDMETYPSVQTNSFVHVDVQTKDVHLQVKGVVEDDTKEHITDQYYMEKDKTWYVALGDDDYKMGNQITLKAMIDEMSQFDFYRAVDYQVDDSRYAQYGLDQPTMTLTVDYQVLDETTAQLVEMEEGINEVQCETLDKQYKLYVGSPTNDTTYADDYYVRLEGSDKVYTMETSALQRLLELKPSDYQVSEVVSGK